MPPAVFCLLFFHVSSVVLQVELETAQQQISLLTQQKELLKERLESVSDYPSLKREKAELQGQQRLLKKQLEEAQEENRLLHAGEDQLLSLSTSQESKHAAIFLSSFPQETNTVRVMMYK